MKKFNYEKYYEGYWNEEHIQRGMDYYSLRYGHIKSFIRPKGQILDVGGGNGQFLEWLGVKKATVLDISKSGLREARKRGFRTIQADVQKKYPLAANSFDSVICFETIEHVDNPVKMLKEIKRCLKPGGTLILGVPNLPADGVHHKKRWYLEDALDVLKKAGIKVEEIAYTPGFIEKETFGQMMRLKSVKKFAVHTAAYCLYLMPFSLKHSAAKKFPNRFAMLFIIKAGK